MRLTGANADSTREVTTTIAAEIPMELKSLKIGFNALYLIDALSGFAGATVSVYLEPKGELSPVLLKDPSTAGLSVLMPMRP